MEKRFRIHTHPLNLAEKIGGYQLTAGDTIENGDFYDSSTGTWKEANENMIGMTIQDGCKAYWVRPE